MQFRTLAEPTAFRDAAPVARQQETQHIVGDWYEYPSWYDILHSAGTADEVTGLEAIEDRFSRARRGASAPSTWLEPMCGTARYLRVAASRGTRVVGLDQNERMLAYARERFESGGLPSRLLCADATAFTSPVRIDFAFCLINSLRHLDSDRAMLDHFASIASALKKGAVYAVGIDLAMYGAEFPSEDVWEGARGRCAVKQVIQYLPGDRDERTERAISHIEVRTPSGLRTLDTVYPLRTYDEAQFQRLVSRSALRIVALSDPWGDDPVTGAGGVIAGSYRIYILARREDPEGLWEGPGSPSAV